MSNIPDLPNFYDMEWTTEDKKLSKDALLYMDDLTQTLDKHVRATNDTGTQTPNKTKAEIDDLKDDAPLGTLWFNTDISKLQVKTHDTPVTVETISSS